MDHDISAGYCSPPRQKLKVLPVSSSKAEQGLWILDLLSLLSQETHLLTCHIKSLRPAVSCSILWWLRSRLQPAGSAPPNRPATQVGMAGGSRTLPGSPSRQTMLPVTDHLSLRFTTHQAKTPPVTESNYTWKLEGGGGGGTENKGMSLFRSNYVKYRSPRSPFPLFSVFALSTPTPRFLRQPGGRSDALGYNSLQRVLMLQVWMFKYCPPPNACKQIKTDSHYNLTWVNITTSISE